MKVIYSSPVADSSVVVTMTLIGVIDDPPDNVTASCTIPDDSATVYSVNLKPITNTTQNSC